MRDAASLSLANAWQRGFPLASRPFRIVGEKSGLSESAVLERFSRLKSRGVIDRIGPVFRPNTVGASSLAAMAVPPARLEEVAALVNEQPGVNHNYEREHRFNLWFVVARATAAEVDWTLSYIEYAAGFRVLRLPLLEEFHIDLGFDLDSGEAPRSPQVMKEVSSEGEKKLAAVVAAGLPLVPHPYEAIARELGISEDEVLTLLAKMLAEGRIRRIGAVVRHRRVGYTANAMAVWDVPDERVREVGRALAQAPVVTLCYRRARALPDWPFNLYCMVHGRDRSVVLRQLSQLDLPYPGNVLFSTRCFKQTAARYG